MLSFKQIDLENLTQGEMKDYWEALPVIFMLIALISLMIFAISSCNPNLGVS